MIEMKWSKGTYYYEKCVICGRRIRVPNDESFYPTNYRYDNYVLKSGPVTALQAGYICGGCLKKPVSQRVVQTP